MSDSQMQPKRRYRFSDGMPRARAACAHDHCMSLHANLYAWRVYMCRIFVRARLRQVHVFFGGSIFFFCWKYIIVHVQVVPVCVSSSLDVQVYVYVHMLVRMCAGIRISCVCSHACVCSYAYNLYAYNLYTKVCISMSLTFHVHVYVTVGL